MSRYFDLAQNCVLYGDTLLPEEAFYTNDTLEVKLVSLAFEVSRGVAELKLTEVELALYSAVVLLSPGRYINLDVCYTAKYVRTFHPSRHVLINVTDRIGLKGISEIGRLNQAVARALRMELERTHAMPIKGDVTVYDALNAQIPTLRYVNYNMRLRYVIRTQFTYV